MPSTWSVSNPDQVHSVSQRDSQSSPDQSPQAISASQSLLTQLLRCAGVVGSAEEEILAIDLDRTTKTAIRLPASGSRAQVEAQLRRQPGMPNLTRPSPPPGASLAGQAGSSHPTPHNGVAPTASGPRPLRERAGASSVAPSRLPQPALPVTRSRRPTSRPLLIVRARRPSLGPSTAPSRYSPASTVPGDLHHRRCGRLGGPLQPSQCPTSRYIYQPPAASIYRGSLQPALAAHCPTAGGLCRGSHC